MNLGMCIHTSFISYTSLFSSDTAKLEAMEVVPSSQPDEIEVLPNTDDYILPGYVYAAPSILLPRCYNPNTPSMAPMETSDQLESSLPPVWSYKVVCAQSPSTEENKENEF